MISCSSLRVYKSGQPVWGSCMTTGVRYSPLSTCRGCSVKVTHSFGCGYTLGDPVEAVVRTMMATKIVIPARVTGREGVGYRGQCYFGCIGVLVGGFA